MRFTLAPVALVVLAACAGGDAPEADTAEQSAVTAAAPPEVEAARVSNDKYSDVNMALGEGYMQDPTGMCVAATDVGAPAELGFMGIHYLNLQYLGSAMPPGEGPPPAGFRLSGTDATIDPALPEVLLYEPTADGGRTLVAIEYLVFEKPWTDAGNTSPPTLAGQPFYRMEDDPATPLDEAHGFEPHYELHVWTHRDNPNGLFAEWNPNVTCPPSGGAMNH
ncbi:MAG: hypothetical protein ACREL7_03265 [Longimicrobiales bacterium]